MQNPEQDFVLKTVKSRDVHFIRFWFSDVLGNVKSFAVVPDELEGAFNQGMGFDGSCIEGFVGSHESDMLAFPDASTFQVLPWRPESNAVARMFCDIKTPTGDPFEGDPRHILMRAVKHAADMGYVLNVGPELEFFYFKDSSSTEVLDEGSYFDLTSLDYASDLRRDTVLTLEKMGIPVEYSHHELAPSQHEIDLRYSDAISMADAVLTYKQVVKEIAFKHGVYASFMPKPLTKYPGSGMHIHMSLFNDAGENAFFDPNDADGYGLSLTAKQFIAGLLKYARDYCLVTNQYVNSYKRLASKAHVPSGIAWAKNNRTCMVRVPGYRPESADSCRVELRSPDGASNPYLAFACMLRAGLAGIEEGLEIPDPVESLDLSKLTSDELARAGIDMLPHTLRDAVNAFESSDLMKDVLGEHTHKYLCQAKHYECDQYERVVTQWELDRLLAVL